MNTLISSYKSALTENMRISSALRRKAVAEIMSAHPDCYLQFWYSEWDKTTFVCLTADLTHELTSLREAAFPADISGQAKEVVAYGKSPAYWLRVERDLYTWGKDREDGSRVKVILRVDARQRLELEEQELLTQLGKLTQQTQSYAALVC